MRRRSRSPSTCQKTPWRSLSTPSIQVSPSLPPPALRWRNWNKGLLIKTNWGFLLRNEFGQIAGGGVNLVNGDISVYYWLNSADSSERQCSNGVISQETLNLACIWFQYPPPPQTHTLTLGINRSIWFHIIARYLHIYVGKLMWNLSYTKL
jgi:hypothetical protein